jgi:glycosyltransferase involved in cell wall biosynthesis
MKPKISIVVPIYNVEKYLNRCLDSLLSQSIKDIEIIAVNDGSTDQSAEVLAEYAAKDKRVIVINKENDGVSFARNFGIKKAQGDFIGFVDPDDWIDIDMYETMYNLATSEQADIVMCSYIREFGTHAKQKKFDLPNKVTYRGDEVQSKIMRRLIGPLKEEVANPEMLDAWGTVWSKLYRTALIKENNLRFTNLNEIGTNEDSLFNIEAFYFAKSFVFVNKPFYHYWRVNNGSVTSSHKPFLKEQWGNLYKRISSFIEEKKLTEEYYSALNNRICLNTLGLGLNTVSKGNQSSIFMKVKKIKSFLNDRERKRSFKQFDLSHFSMVWRAFYFFAKIRSALCFYCMLVTIEWLRRVVR